MCPPRFGQRYTIITVDQALYCKLVELKWQVPQYQERLVVQLGGLHISMNFLKTIGDHMKDRGLLIRGWRVVSLDQMQLSM